MEPYTELFREHFPAYGIPANITSRFRLEQNGLITALFSALSILAENYDLRVTRGYQAWRRRIGRRIEFLTTRIRTLADPDERRSVELELETLRRAERSIESLHDTLAEFSTRLVPGEFRAAFLRLIAKLRGTENMAADSRRDGTRHAGACTFSRIARRTDRTVRT
jgi:hypothetical protein